MSIHDLRAAQVHFESQIKTVIAAKQELYKIRNEFTSYYTDQRISKMPIDNYAIGNDLPDKGFNFCYTIERQLDGLGRIIGANSFKFGVYYGRTKSDNTYKYRYTKKFGSSVKEAYETVKHGLLELIKAGRSEDIEAIRDNIFSPMFKGKILSVYFPERYLNLFADSHLEHFLIQFGLGTEEHIWSDEVIKREILVNYKNQDKIMRDWPLDIFTHFLYRVYPGRPNFEEESSKNNKDLLADYRNPTFPSDINPQWVSLKIMNPQPGKTKKVKGKNSNPDYDKESRLLKKLGDRGETIVLDMERQRLVDNGRKDLAKKVKKAKYDYMGYDIKSFESNGESRYIEVKATRSKVGTANFFLSANELKKAKRLPNYYIYMVYGILSKSPKVWIISNPFEPENKKVIQTPISYRVTIRAST